MDFLTWLKELNPLHKRTQRIGPSKDYLIPTTKPSYDSENWIFSIWLKNWTLFVTQKNWTFNFFFSKWLTELNPFFLEVTQRIELLFWKYDPQDWTFFLNTTQRKWLNFVIWYALWCDPQNLTLFSTLELKELKRWRIFQRMTQQNWTLFSKKTQRSWTLKQMCRLIPINWTFWWHRLQNVSCEIQEFEPFLSLKQNWTFFFFFFFFMTQRRLWTTFFWTYSHWTLFWMQELNILFEHDSQNWTLFECDLNNWTGFSKIWLQELNLLHWVTQRIEPSSQNDSKNWTFLKIIWLQDVLNFFVTREMELFSIWIKELRLFFQQYHSTMIDPFFNMTHRIEPFWKTWFIEIEPSFQHDSKMSPFLSMTSRIILFYKMYDSKNWNFWKKKDSKNWTLFLFDVTQRIELFFNLTQRIEFFFFFSEWLKDFVEYDSKNRTFLWIWLKVLSLFFNMTQGIESSFSEWLEDLNLILQMSQRIKPFLKKKKMTRRIDLLKNISNYRNFLMTQRIELLLKKTVTHRTEPFFHMIHRIEPFFSTWLKELNLFF